MSSKAHPIHLLLPMSGQGTRFQAAGYRLPKPLIPVSSRPMIERLLNVFPKHWPSFAAIADNHLDTPLPDTLRKIRPDIHITSIAKHARGPGHALLQLLPHIDPEAPVLVSYCDYGMSWDAQRFEEFVRSTDCDACVISYRGFHAHYLSPVPYAYSRMEQGRVLEVKEKGWFGPDREDEYASCGAYYFKSAALLAKALEQQEIRDLCLNGEMYTSLTVEALLRSDPEAKVNVFEIPYFYQWGTPEDLRNFEYWERCLTHAARYQGSQDPAYRVDQVLMPMCGLGSRFTSVTGIPKAFIPIDGEPMYQVALHSLPRGPARIVSLDAHRNHFQAGREAMTYLAETPSGQALSVAAGLPSLTADADIVISSCDHAIVLNPATWARFRQESRADAAIFTIKGYPSGSRKPEAYAWVKVKDAEGPFPEVTGVSVKKPISGKVHDDHLLVGTFWFRNKAVLSKGLERLLEKDVRVNGEIYLDSVFEELLATGLRVEVLELDGFICWGDPDSLAESLYWQEVYFGRSYTKRPRFPGVPVHGSV